VNWTLLYDPDVIRYLYSLRESGANIRSAVRLLSLGIPEDARQLREDPEIWEWLEARHWIIFAVDRRGKRIYVTNVMSATVE
jgi:hypothetical protein